MRLVAQMNKHAKTYGSALFDLAREESIEDPILDDLKLLTESEYEVQKVGVVDQFCHSTHVECIACIQKIKDRKD